jgi:intein-encoded DNA endonuclease-like protein
MSKPVIATEEHINVVELYKSGMSQLQIEKLYNVSHGVVARILTKYDIDFRDASHKSRKYTLDELYFDSVDNNNKAYILGLLYADGCNYTKTNMIKIELQERDKDILDKINIELGSNRPLKYCTLNSKNNNWQNTYRLTIVNKHMSEALSALGMIPNKSLILDFPEWLDESLIPHFIRGYMDGDGHIEWRKTKFLTMVSTKQFCMRVKEICENKLGICAKIQDTANKSSNTKLLYICGKTKMKQFLDYIYNDADLYIQRKYDTYKTICDEMNVNNSL